MNENYSTVIHDVFPAMVIFVTIPIISASAERSLPKLKLIKNDLHNTMSINR